MHLWFENHCVCLYTVIFRSYEGTTITFNYGISTFCNEKIFPLILKDTLKIFSMFLGLHSLYPLLCSVLQAHLYSCISGSLDFCWS